MVIWVPDIHWNYGVIRCGYCDQRVFKRAVNVLRPRSRARRSNTANTKVRHRPRYSIVTILSTCHAHSPVHSLVVGPEMSTPLISKSALNTTSDYLLGARASSGSHRFQFSKLPHNMGSPGLAFKGNRGRAESSEILGSHGLEYKDGCLLGCSAV
jgi:hypothetical protein